MFRRSKSNQRRDVKKRRGFQPGLETLEDRMVPSTFRPPPTILTGVDMSTMATIVGGYYSGPAHLYLNFDGASEGSAVALSEQTIQQTLYRLSEIYAPFNVEVSRLYGPGYYDTSRDGSTTIFIGKSPEGDTYTPDENSDYPHLGI